MFSLPCGFSSSDPNKVLYHTLNCQWTQKNEKFGIRQKLFDKSVGTLMYRSIHFGILVSDIKSKIKKKSFFQTIITGKKSHEIDKITDNNYFSESFQTDTCMHELYELIRSYPSLQ